MSHRGHREKKTRNENDSPSLTRGQQKRHKFKQQKAADEATQLALRLWSADYVQQAYIYCTVLTVTAAGQ